MTLSELRGELERRGLDLSGTKASLELRLAQAMVVEIAGPDAASGLGLGQDGGAGAEGQDGGKVSVLALLVGLLAVLFDGLVCLCMLHHKAPFTA